MTKMKFSSLLIFTILTVTSYSQNYQIYFDSFGVSGSTTIFDYKNQKWIYTDSIDAIKETLPASTFKILNSLIALEYKAVKDENEVLKWDEVERTIGGVKMTAWNKDTDLKTAFKNSTVWFYVELANRLGRKKYEEILPKCKYGNHNFSEKGTDFWNYGEFAVSPVNQIEFLVNLYENKLPFSTQTMEKVKEIMISEQTEKGTFRDKTGWTDRHGKDIGWWVGYLETKENIWFFATRLSKNADLNNPNFAKARREITKQLLKQINAI